MRFHAGVLFAALIMLTVRSGIAVPQNTETKKKSKTLTQLKRVRASGATKRTQAGVLSLKQQNLKTAKTSRPDLTASLEIIKLARTSTSKLQVRITIGNRNSRSAQVSGRVKVSIRALSGTRQQIVPLQVKGGDGRHAYVALGSRRSVSLTGTVNIRGLPTSTKLAAVVDSQDGEEFIPRHGRVLETNESNNQSRWVAVASSRGTEFAGPQPEPPEPIDFERFSGGIVPTPGQSLRNEYRAKGVFFPDGITVFRSGDAEVQRARSGKNVAASRQAGEFRNHPLRIQFTQPQQKVSMYLMHIRSGNGKTVNAKIEAYDDRGRVVGTNRRNFRSDGRNWTRILVDAGSPVIRRVVLTGGSKEAPNTNFLLIDDLAFSGGKQQGTTADTQAPVITIFSPTNNSRTTNKLPKARARITDDGYLSRVSYKLDRQGDGKEAAWKTLAGGINDPIPDKQLNREWQLSLGSRRFDPTLGFQATGYGRYTLTVRARDVAGNESERSVNFDYQPLPSTDVWVLGMEYNQGTQDVVHTHLQRGAIMGSVPLGHPTGRDTSLAWPIVPGKPMVVRVYVGVRKQSRNSLRGVPVTGQLRVEAAEIGGRRRAFQPFKSKNCFDHLGRQMPSNNPVTAYPTLGKQGYRTVSPYCIDLIASRIHWGGTLNFIVPAEFTEHLTRGAELSVTVRPVGFQESSPKDNVFKLSLQNVAKRNTAKLRVVRLSPNGAPAPTKRDVRRVIEDMKLLTKYSQIEIVSDDEFAYQRSQVRVQGKLLGMKIVERELNECNSLWLMLAQRYGIRKDETLLAFLPQSFTPRSCATLRGVGWRVPKPELLRDALSRTGRTDYHGGAAWVFMPKVSQRKTDAEEYWDQVATVAHEFYHAHLDARHEETGNGERSGTALSDLGGFADVLEGISDIAGFGIDFASSKPPNHPRGVIGSYPAASVEIGRPGGPSGHPGGAVPGSSNRSMVRVAGFLGNVGARIEEYDRSYRLTLYDPCPTGPIDRSRPRSQLTRRINDESQYAPRIADEYRPHGFMSYSTNPWISARPKPNIKNLNWAH